MSGLATGIKILRVLSKTSTDKKQRLAVKQHTLPPEFLPNGKINFGERKEAPIKVPATGRQNHR